MSSIFEFLETTQQSLVTSLLYLRKVIFELLNLPPGTQFLTPCSEVENYPS